MGDCDETLRELETFLDEELSGNTKEMIRSHLGGCHNCLETFDFYAELRQVISAKCRNDELPAGLMARIQQCFGDELGSEQAPSGG